MEPQGRPDRVDDRVHGPDFMKMNLLHLPPMDPPLHGGQMPQDLQGRLFDFRRQGTSVNQRPQVSIGAVGGALFPFLDPDPKTGKPAPFLPADQEPEGGQGQVF